MSSEFFGHTGTRQGSDVVEPSGSIIDTRYILDHVRQLEDAGIDKLLMGAFSIWPDNNQLAAFVLANTRKIGSLLAHRTGFVAPTMAARQLATLDHFGGGRLWVHIITGGSDADQARDGDFLSHDDRYQRTDEYLTILRRYWAANEPFDHEGRFYKLEGAFSQVKPLRGHIPISFGGSSDAAIAVAGKHADVYALWGEPLDGARETISKVRNVATRYDRADAMRFTLAFRIVVADTEDKAWEKAAGILETVKKNVDRTGGNGERKPTNVGSVRLREAAARGKVLDKRLWTEVAEVSGAAGNSTAFVGTPQQIADALLEYYDIGVSNFLLRGFYPTEDTVSFGKEIVPLVKAGIAAREVKAAAA